MARLAFLLLLLWVGVTASTEVDLQKRIFNGKDCGPKEHPHYVSLSNNPTGNPPHCGGSLIDEQWVLTAAHCCNSLFAVVGGHPGPGKVLKIEEKRIYLNHDIMLMKLEDHNEKVTLIALPDNATCSTSPKIGEEVRIAGRGRYLKDTKDQMIPDKPKTLQCAVMHVAKCNHAAIKTCKPNEPDENWICYKEPKVDTCSGDSGGGLIYNGMLRGVHSGGGELICTLPAFSLDVCFYKEWIKEVKDKKVV